MSTIVEGLPAAVVRISKYAAAGAAVAAVGHAAGITHVDPYLIVIVAPGVAKAVDEVANWFTRPRDADVQRQRDKLGEELGTAIDKENAVLKQAEALEDAGFEGRSNKRADTLEKMSTTVRDGFPQTSEISNFRGSLREITNAQQEDQKQLTKDQERVTEEQMQLEREQALMAIDLAQESVSGSSLSHDPDHARTAQSWETEGEEPQLQRGADGREQE
jgi:hypothetical protein